METKTIALLTWVIGIMGFVGSYNWQTIEQRIALGISSILLIIACIIWCKHRLSN